MSNYKNCRNAKTAEEYLLKCLFQAEEERDKAVAYCDGVREAEEERIKAAEEAQRELEEKAKNAPVFEVKETKTVCYEVADDYRFYKKDYGLADVETLTNALNLNDEDLYEWANESYHGEDRWYSVIPIKRFEKTYDYTLTYCSGDEDDLHTFVSETYDPESFTELETNGVAINTIYPVSKDEEIKAFAITKLREALQRAINRLNEEADKDAN